MVVCCKCFLVTFLVERTLTPLRVIGAEDGLYEFQVDLFSRKLFPSISMR